ncbi:MAG: hypothetical protein Q9M18_02565 [Mariprofundaceae bacterium]|nr:hypothetical protein [Mariprofundaceae bacterium]
MIRNIMITLLFFFGPALLMILLRNIFLFWRFRRSLKHQRPDVINITPNQYQKTSPSRFFLASAIIVGLICTFLAWSQVHRLPPHDGLQYVPAHINQHGELVDGAYVSKP